MDDDMHTSQPPRPPASEGTYGDGRRNRAREAWDQWDREWNRKGRDRDIQGRTKTGQIRGLGGLIGTWAESDEVRGRLREAMIAVHWAEIAGDKVAEQSAPGQLERGTLYVKVPDSAWRHQLSYMRRELVGKINAAVGTGTVKEIRFTA